MTFALLTSDDITKVSGKIDLISAGASPYNMMPPRSQGQVPGSQGQGMYMNVNGENYPPASVGNDSNPTPVCT